MVIERFTELEVWKLAHELVLDVYKFTPKLPKDEIYGISSQMKRAAVSVPANIAEGFKRKGFNDKAHFYNIAQASLEELRYYYILSSDLGFDVNLEKLNEKADKIGCMLTRLIQCVRQSR